MKKLRQLIAILLVLMLCFSSCGEYNPAIQRPGGSTEGGGDNGGSDKPEGGYTFTASLYYDGKIFIPEEEIDVQWTDGFSVYTARIGEDGVATVNGLDGDYSVSISSIPEGYIYNPNSLKATNNDRNIRIDLYKITKTTGKGTDEWHCIKLQKPGIFSAVIEDADDVVFYQFTPSTAGVYSVESWVNVTDNAINPKIDVYNGSIAFKQYAYTLDDGGTESYYTKNFKYEIKISKEGISSTGGGGQAFTFAIKATAKDNVYPVTVDFVVTLDGGFDSGLTSAPIVPMMDLPERIDMSSSEYTFVGPEDIISGKRVFVNANYKLWAVEDGGDGYFHRYDPVQYASTGGYGPIVYAYITQPCRYLDASFTTVEDRGNKALTVDGVNYKMAIQGFEALTKDPPGDNGPYFCVSNCPCYVGMKSDLIGPDGQPVVLSDGTVEQWTYKCIGACRSGCENCSVDCRHPADEVMDMFEQCTLAQKGKAVHRPDCPGCAGYKLPGENDRTWHTFYYLPDELLGYQHFANSDGLVPVTQGIKDFLQAFSISQLYFFDGDGFVENNESYPVDAAEDAQWLFACGYYKPR